MTDTVIVRPVMFTDRLPRMRWFLELLGLRARVESERGGWVDMVAGAGMVALHSAESSVTGADNGDIRLGFEALDLELLAGRLSLAGFTDATVWDEAYGRVLSVTDPLGDQIWVDEYNEDNYGYRVYEPERDPRLSVMPILYTEAVDEMGVFLEAVGLTARPTDSARQDGWEKLLLYGGHTGLVAVYPEPFQGEGLGGGPGAVRLGFETQEPLTELADRLKSACHRDAIVLPGDFRDGLCVVIPHGHSVVVRPAPPTEPV